MNGKLLLPHFLLLDAHFKAKWQLQNHTLFSRISEKNKMKKEPVSVPCQIWKYLFKRAASTVVRAKYQVPAGWVGGECLKDAVSRHQEAAVLLQCCSWCFVRSDSCLRFKARRKLVTHHQWVPQKTEGKVPLTCLHSSLVSRYLDTMLGNFSGMWRHSGKCFYFLTFHLFPRVNWGYVEYVQL